jgi:hypothetical protein
MASEKQLTGLQTLRALEVMSSRSVDGPRMRLGAFVLVHAALNGRICCSTTIPCLQTLCASPRVAIAQ